ncbi:DMT family transporter [uncultured Roseovarius sp.]|uniref:DMT family transporter n=1 Tax=uncultured Roseovarius sp. TaxID=293344 RepID=UPI00261F5DF0|nr:DMT family transporter [uncultured Roseovarius sp.]
MLEAGSNRQAIGLLLYTGGLFGLNFPLGKLAAGAGVSPLIWALVVSIGAAGLLLPGLILQGRLTLPRGQMLRYTVISGLLSFALVNALVFFLIPRVGAGYAGLMFALSPVVTLALTALAGLKIPGRLGLYGIGLGLIGAVLVALGRGSIEGAAIWSVLAFAIPFALALGNVYRTLDWPEGAHPAALAFWSHSWAILTYVVLQLGLSGDLPLDQLREVPLATIIQAIAAGLMFPAYFRLQQVGGPVLLSQIGYVAAAVGLGTGTVLLGEVYGIATWAGAAIIALGIGLTVRAQIKRAPRPSSCTA